MTDSHPASWFDTPPGKDGTITSREEIRAWLKMRASTSDRIRFTTFGISTEGRPLDAIFIGNDITEPAFDRFQAERAQFAATALSTGPSITGVKPIVLITSGIHATELGGPQSVPELVHDLLTSEAPEIEDIRERVVTIVVPSLNPDGMDLVKRWHDRTAGTEQQGSLSPLLYHRFAGHDNNRDWLFRNLVETRQVMDGIHNRWLPHVTLDQHQMNKHGPRFVLPPYADPWEPHVHPSTIAASSSLGQVIAAEMTAAGMTGVLTGRYFDAWEPSRALQHYRGGVRILAEAANANVAYPSDVTPEQLASSPLPLDVTPSTSSPAPWKPGAWRLRDIMDYHIAAAMALLKHVSRTAELWPRIQHDALSPAPDQKLVFHIPFGRSAGDVSANQRLADVLKQAGARCGNADHSTGVVFDLGQPTGRLIGALLKPTVFPQRHGPTSYDLTTHHLPLFMGATVRAGRPQQFDQAPAGSAPGHGAFLAIDARDHMAPSLIEPALAANEPVVWRTQSRELVDGSLIEPGTWIVKAGIISSRIQSLAGGPVRLARLPESVRSVRRKDVVVLNIGDTPTADYGWTRWWLHDRSIPFLDTDVQSMPSPGIPHGEVTYILPEATRAQLDDGLPDLIRDLLAEGATAIAFGSTGRFLAPQVTASVTSHETPAESGIQAPGALLRLIPDRSTPLGMGLDRSVPAMYQRDGSFSIADGALDATALARFASRDTLISGWMSDTRCIAGKPAVLEIRYGAGMLYAFAFRPLFRGQMLVTSPLVHNLLYSKSE